MAFCGSECIALAEARGSTATLDEGFTKDVEEGIARRRQPRNPPAEVATVQSPLPNWRTGSIARAPNAAVT